MRKLSAHYIYTLTGLPVPHGVITVDKEGVITGIGTSEPEMDHGLVEFYDGIIVPGFVNAHCHLELSHLKGKIPVGKGLDRFVGEIFRQREASGKVVVDAAEKADQEMYDLGISGVGDISNTTATIRIKKESKIRYFTFAEAFGFHPSRADRAIEYALSVKHACDHFDLPASVVPHSPYSVSHLLFQKIYELDRNDCTILSLHHQESRAENRFFRVGNGLLRDHIEKNLGIDTSFWHPTGKTSTESVLPLLNKDRSLLLVHNTFTTLRDLHLLKKSRSMKNTWLVLCANSNLYIEHHLPPVTRFRKEGMPLCLGTDSLASNYLLSPIAEMITLQEHFPELSLQEMLTWACLNGANALGMEQTLGSLEPGKKPGLVLITGVDLNRLKLTRQSISKRLI